ncbi:RNA methyltransferase [Babesia gibsoni]|uniref:RNA methyltransferase n=1 Tax=Babesia gibsoni TaxID=33632 RepID=A0AAD8PEZ9_BABGI|nr:RNA methyltransferase [Babesia gibsoni]
MEEVNGECGEGVASSTDEAMMEGSNIDKGDTRKLPKGRMGWRARCREMQGVHRRKKDQKNGIQPAPQRERINYSSEIAQNPEFEKYYRDQRICPEENWDEFIACCKTALPSSFRFNTCVPLWRNTIQRIVKVGMEHAELGLTVCLNHGHDYLKLEPGCSLYYQITADKPALRKNEQIVGFRKCLIEEDYRGALTRQETVSMLPVIYLDPQPHENILDLCAAPGMKYTQILDTVHSALIYRNRQSPCENRGMIVANDVCQNRVSTLSHHVKAMNFPSAAVTNYDASRFPTLYNACGQKIYFDRILADVPCSCDGTMRKTAEIWNTWKATGGLHMHKVQMQIVKRALQLLKVGGTMVYSTCSINPLENEAIASYIVSEGYREHGVELQPLQKLEGFKTLPGLTQWLVPSPAGGYFESYDQVPPEMRDRINPTMFKSPEWNDAKAQHVMRVMPHDNDTGAFFLFKVKKVVSREAEEAKQEIRPVDVAVTDPDTKRISLKRGSKLLHEYLMYKDTNPDGFGLLCDFYGIGDDVRHLLEGILVTKRHCRACCYLIGRENIAAIFHKRKGQKMPRIGSEKQPDPEKSSNEETDLENAVQESDVEIATGKGRKNDTDADQMGQRKWERCKYALLGMRAFKKLDSKSTSGAFCQMRISHEAAMTLMTMIKRRLVFGNMLFCEEIVKGNVVVKRLLEHEHIGNLSSLDTCRKEGTLESGGCIVVVVPQWGKAKIPTKGIKVDQTNGITFDTEHMGEVEKSITPIPDLMDTMPIACVISDTGSLFSYASTQAINLLQKIVETQ